MSLSLGPGAFVAVVGASGVGKDTMLEAARSGCGEDVFFPRRAITRPDGPGEDFASLSPQDFEEAWRRGAFAVRWRAHGLDYGIPAEADAAIEQGRVVVANVSRGQLDLLAGRYERLVVVLVTVSDEVRAQRLRSRGREAADDIARRLSRAAPDGDREPDHVIPNDGTIKEAGARLLEIIDAARTDRKDRV